MDLFKGLVKTAMVSGVAVLAFHATSAGAADNEATVGHVSASVSSLLEIHETAPIKFGNFSLSNPTPTGVAKILMAPTGDRTATSDGANEVITLLNGQTNTTGATAVADDAGAQQPGTYHLDTGAGAGAARLFVSFGVAGGADGQAHIVADETINPAASGVHTSQVKLSNAAATAIDADNVFWVDSFRIASIDGVSVVGFEDIGTGTSGGTTPGDTWGQYVDVNAATGTADIAVGATLHTDGGASVAGYVAGAYRGTFNIMVSY